MSYCAAAARAPAQSALGRAGAASLAGQRGVPVGPVDHIGQAVCRTARTIGQDVTTRGGGNFVSRLSVDLVSSLNRSVARYNRQLRHAVRRPPLGCRSPRLCSLTSGAEDVGEPWRQVAARLASSMLVRVLLGKIVRIHLELWGMEMRDADAKGRTCRVLAQTRIWTRDEDDDDGSGFDYLEPDSNSDSDS